MTAYQTLNFVCGRVVMSPEDARSWDRRARIRLSVQPEMSLATTAGGASGEAARSATSSIEAK